MTTMLGMLNTKGLSIESSPVSAQSLAKLLKLLENNTINIKGAKTIFEEMVETDKNPETIVKEKNLEQVSDTSELENVVITIIEKNPKEVEAYKNGKTKLFSFFMGQVMRETKGKADPKIITEIINTKLQDDN